MKDKEKYRKLFYINDGKINIIYVRPEKKKFKFIAKFSERHFYYFSLPIYFLILILFANTLPIYREAVVKLNTLPDGPGWIGILGVSLLYIVALLAAARTDEFTKPLKQKVTLSCFFLFITLVMVTLRLYPNQSTTAKVFAQNEKILGWFQLVSALFTCGFITDMLDCLQSYLKTIDFWQKSLNFVKNETLLTNLTVAIITALFTWLFLKK